MLKEFYSALRLHLATAMPELNTIALYNGQYDYSDMELPIVCPAVYIEFAALPWLTGGLHTQESEAEIKLHLVMDYMLQSRYDEPPYHTASYDLEILDRIEALAKTMQGWQAVTNGIAYSTELMRATTETELNDGLHVWIMTYRCRLIDNSLNRDRDMIDYVLPGVGVSKK